MQESPDSPQDRPDSLVWRVALVSAGGTLLLTGLLVLLAWSVGEQDYVQLDSAFPPLHYNPALGFVLWGLGYLALAAERYRAARRLALVLGSLGFAGLGGSIFGLELRLDRWLIDSRNSSRASPQADATGGMAIGLCLAALALFLAARQKAGRLYAIAGTVIGVVLVVGGPVLLLTPRVSSHFGQPSGPSVLGMVGVGVAGLALLTSLCRKGLPSFALGHLLPIVVGLVGVLLTFALWVGLNADQDHRIYRQVQFEAATAQRLAQDRLPEQVNKVVELAEGWLQWDNDQKRDRGGSYVGRLPGCLGIARIDGKLSVAWLETFSNVSLPTTAAELGVVESLGSAVQAGRVVVLRPARSYWRGTRVLVVFAPHRSGTSEGGLISVIRLQDLFATIINTNVAAGYSVTVSENDGVIFGRFDSERTHHDRWNQTLPLNFRELNWELSAWPTPDVLERASLSLPKLALVLGLLTTALLALAVHLARTARKRTFALENEVRERELAQRALGQSEEKYRTLIENLGQGIFLQDREHRYLAANAQFCRSVGRTEAEILGLTEAALFDPQRAASLAEEVRTVLVEGKSVESEEDSLTDGRRSCVRRVLTPVRDSSGQTTGVLGICWDVTEQRQLEVHVHQASKMDAIGQLAGGIAHDFNNLLTVILGNLELILTGSDENDPNTTLAIAARNAAARATSLTQRLLGFSRQHQLDWMPTNLNTTIEEVVALLRHTIDPLIRIETRFTGDLWPVQADPAQLHQVLMNLYLNARDAIVGAGQITIETTCVCNSASSGTSGWNSRAGDFVRLRVSDTGSGMTPEVKARIYEPFFTTKEVGKGTGLGLPMVFAIVRQHKGWIECWSEPGRGTRFDVYLPRGEAARIAPPEPLRTLPQRSGKETILVVDDEEMIRQLASATLRARGYTVLQAEDGQQAIDLYSQELDRIDLIVLDLTMPILSGHEAFRHLLELNPRVKVLFASGYAVEQLSDLEKELMAGFVKKPYRPNELVLAVEESLQRRGQSYVADHERKPPDLLGADRSDVQTQPEQRNGLFQGHVPLDTEAGPRSLLQDRQIVVR